LANDLFGFFPFSNVLTCSNQLYDLTCLIFNNFSSSLQKPDFSIGPNNPINKINWCEVRLAALPAGGETVLINHWPLRYDLARPPRVPRFSLWCGTTRTEDWPRRFHARAVVSGHLHMRTTIVRHGVRHEEVSLGYPRDWHQDRGVDWYLRDVLPPAGTRSSRFAPARDPFMMPHQ
jgi:hypothetical protein